MVYQDFECISGVSIWPSLAILIKADDLGTIFFLKFSLLIITHETFVGYSKAPEEPWSNTRQSHIVNMGCEPVTIRIAAYRSSPCYALRHGSLWTGINKL